ncbi:TetR/AcrR family transcriptional regulator [Paenibacillus camelliae]|uniref:TetR/AcrR family transcriptional regulator n=1 Tax=Paenibacillus camelliae TaxID=512410 RepID=UPI00203DD74A|nr:TetR/AcrR family transcriptional regulator [Paenibacillus camelliae]MCM3634066.1 TetR/AcrR family transcriptional regulator [Paenibacillus camelliae]
MPKIISEHERAKTKNAIFENTKKLICTNNGIKNITVDDIAKSVGMGKGSFYSYYNSKEECLYDVIKKWETALFEQFETIMKTEMMQREKITMFIRERYLSEDSISRYVSPTDMDILLRKLPSEFSEAENEKSKKNMEETMKMFNINIVQMEVLGALLDCVGNLNNNTSISIQGKTEAIDRLIIAIVDYIEESEGK